MSYMRSKPIFIAVSLIILVPLFFLNLFNSLNHRDREIAERQRHASYITSQIERMLGSKRFAAAEDPGMFIEYISDLIPDHKIVIILDDSNHILTSSLNAPSEEITNWMIDAIGNLRKGHPADAVMKDDIRLARPVTLRGGESGYLFTIINIRDIRRDFLMDIIIPTVAICMVWVLVMLLFRALTARFNRNLEILSYQIEKDEENCDNVLLYPEIKPILERISRKNIDLRTMAQKYINETYKMKQLMDMTPLGILSIDERGTITACNATYAQFYPDVDQERLIGMNIRALSKHSRMPDVENSIEQALAGVVTHANMLEHDQRVLLVYAYPIYDENQMITGALGICQDITEIEKLRNELHRIDRLQIIGQMAASFAHEVRNPLTVIRGFMQLMQRQMDPMKIQDYLKMVISELDRSNEIIGNFLSLSQNRFLQKDMINLNRIIEEIETLLIAEANHSNIELIIEKDPNLQDLLLNDKEIKQLILNLTRNGMESMSGGGKLYIRTVQLPDAALLEVQDTGHGIPQDKLDQLFEPFYTTKPSGTGLGLAVCLSIVERHQAKIDVKSQESVGTTFTIRFNVQDEASKNAG
mgnify:CR=1 FL=1